MFSMGADLMGTADNCSPVSKAHFSNEASISFYCLSDETPYIFLKSKIFEYVFTDQALIKIERDNAAGVKQYVRRYDWQTSFISDVRFETPGAGMTDYACEIKFILANQEFSIDIVKAEIATARIYYSILLKLSREQHQNSMKLRRAESLLTNNMINEKNIGQIAIDAANVLQSLSPISYKHIFESLDAYK